MPINPILNSGVQGVQAGLASARNNAERIASFGTTESGAEIGGLAEPLIGLKQDLLQVRASAEVISTVDEILTGLFDQDNQS